MKRHLDKPVLLALAFAGCAPTSVPRNEDIDAGVIALPSDAFYIQTGQSCPFELAFCSDGTYQMDLCGSITASTYQLENGVAVDQGFEFDFTSQEIGMDFYFDSQPWIAVHALQHVGCP